MNRCCHFALRLGDTWFDRSLCPEPCGSTHDRCKECGSAVDFCPLEKAFDE